MSKTAKITIAINTRKIAYDILREIDEKEAYSNLVIGNYFKRIDLSPMDRGFITQLVYGVLERKITLDYYISKFSKTRIKKIHPNVLELMRLAAYQIIYLSKTPDSAAVNESVKLVKKINYKSSGFVNGVLRSLIREYEKVQFPDIKKEPVKHLSVKYSHAEWIVSLLIKEYEMEKTIEILEGNVSTPKLSIRVNTLKTSKAELIEVLENIGIEVSDSKISEDGLLFEKMGHQRLDEIEAFKDGHFTVQDESSMLVAETLKPEPGEKVIDLCSAPGGKTTHMAQYMKNQGTIIACDIYEHKLNKVEENCERLGITNVQTAEWDGQELNAEWVDSFDKVLVDAPCSGLGIIRRKPEIKYSKSYEDVLNLVKIQYNILENASKYLKVGGTLLYSTCTITKEENDGVIEQFMNDNKEFELDGDVIKILPARDGADGFFICKIKRMR